MAEKFAMAVLRGTVVLACIMAVIAALAISLAAACYGWAAVTAPSPIDLYEGGKRL